MDTSLSNPERFYFCLNRKIARFPLTLMLQGSVPLVWGRWGGGGKKATETKRGGPKVDVCWSIAGVLNIILMLRHS